MVQFQAARALEQSLCADEAGFEAKIDIQPLQRWILAAYRAISDHLSAPISEVLVSLGIYGLAQVSLQKKGIYSDTKGKTHGKTRKRRRINLPM